MQIKPNFFLAKHRDEQTAWGSNLNLVEDTVRQVPSYKRLISILEKASMNVS